MTVSNEHRIMCELALLFCREYWLMWPAAIEPIGFNGRNYDVLGIKSKPRDIVAIEVKASRSDFMSGIKKGQFNKSNYITELWLVYDGTFEIQELPSHVGILRLIETPICLPHAIAKRHLCDAECKNKKTIYFSIDRKAKQIHDNSTKFGVIGKYEKEWLWKLATSNSTRLLNNIKANLIE